MKAHHCVQLLKGLLFGCLVSSLPVIFTMPGSMASAEKFSSQQGLGWASHRNLSSDRYGELFTQYRQRGWMLVDVEAYSAGRGTRYAMVWRENPEGLRWRQWRNMTSEGYNTRWTEMREAGFMPVDIEGYMVGSNLRFAGIWLENQNRIRWASNRNMTSERFLERHRERRNSGLRPVDIEPYETPQGLRWAAIWHQDDEQIDWTMRIDMTRREYLDAVSAQGQRGFQVRDYEVYNTNRGTRYAAIWERHDDMPAYQLRTNRNNQQYRNLWNEYRDRGYRLADFEASHDGTQYSGIWVANSQRHRYAHRQAIDNLIENYKSQVDTPGISVAIMHDGRTVYRRGFGDADPARGHKAHGQTVYSAASISKVLGSTLAAKIEAEGELADGTIVNLDLSRPTRQYLNNVPRSWPRITFPFRTVTLPSHHTHTVEQLTAHLGCVVHYPDRTTPGISNNAMVGVYPTALSAATEIWDETLVEDPECEVGDNWVYSTHAFTIVGAVLERVTGRTIHRLVREEISDAWELNSVRSQFETSPLRANAERAVPPHSYVDSSWKVLGGGIELHAVDLARFGWRVLDGQIVDGDVRDERLWAPVAEGCIFGQPGVCLNGLGWRLERAGGRRFVGHGGQGSGARTELRIYPDDGLVIAIMMNRAHSSTSPRNLAASIAAEIL